VDFAKYPDWNPVMEIAGQAVADERLTVSFSRPSGRSFRLKPRVLVAERGRELRWLGRMLAPNLFDGEHRFEIREPTPGHVTFVQGERFRGLLVPFLRKLIEIDTVANFRRSNEALAARVAALRVAV
jgi:hypothetical protein